ncbi:hypothetical protein QUV15_22555, partial [Xanthomonas citri pv. citri]
AIQLALLFRKYLASRRAEPGNGYRHGLIGRDNDPGVDPVLPPGKAQVVFPERIEYRSGNLVGIVGKQFSKHGTALSVA